VTRPAVLADETPPDNDLLNTKQSARVLDRAHSVPRYHVARGRLTPALVVGRTTLYHRADIEALRELLPAITTRWDLVKPGGKVSGRRPRKRRKPTRTRTATVPDRVKRTPVL
jgi:hypothetical protein